ncbi:hypothetical protein [Bartonella sp. CB178]|uniref:hypothetical protein n=1 Tax=Bartonella sp. CB178 TaxID=3112255 RepID=UPI00300E5831
MVDFNSEYKENLKYWLACIVGFVAILTIIIVGGFYIAKPHLDDFVKREIARHSIKAIRSEVSVIGKVNLRNVTIPMPANMSLRIGALSARPPIAFIPGTFTLYDVDLKYNNIHVRIPKISINSVSLEKNDTTVASRFLQFITRVKLSSIVAPSMLISIENENKLTDKIEVKNLQLYGLKNGHIYSVDVETMNLGTTAANGAQPIHIVARSNAIKARDIDIRYAYSVFFGRSNFTNQGKTITGLIALDDTIVDIFKGKEKSTSFSLGRFKTSGLKMKTLKQAPEKLIRAYLSAKKKGNKTAQKTVRNAAFMDALLAVTSIDAKMDKFSINTPQLKAKFDSFQFKPSQWERPVPKKLLLSLDNFSVVPGEIEREDLDFLKNVNFEQLILSGKLDISYDEQKRAISLNVVSFDMKDIGSGEISARISGVDEEVFSGQKNVMIASFQNFCITEASVRYTDAGLIDHLFSHLAQKFNDDKYDLKKELYDDFYLIMTQSPKLLLKNSDKTEIVSKSLGDFAKNPKTLTIKITTKDEKGLRIADLGADLQNNLSAVLSKMNLTIENESSPL